MAITAFPFDNQDTDETQFTTWSKELQDSGVVDSAGGTGFAVAAGSGMAVTVRPGTAIVRGHMMQSTAAETLAIPAANAGTTIHRIILRLDPTANTISLAVLAGTSGGAAPALTQTAGGIFEIALAHVVIPPSTISITPGMISDQRAYTGQRLRVWTTDTRPSNARLGAMGWNRSTSHWEFWTGDAWTDVVPDIEPGRVEMTLASTAPAGWHLINGQSLSKTTNPGLFAMLGYTHGGSGDNFNLPTVADKFPIGASAAKALRSSGGSATSTLAVGHLPPHTHDMQHGHGTVGSRQEVEAHTHQFPVLAKGGHVGVTGGGANNVPRLNEGLEHTLTQSNGHTHLIDMPHYWGSTGSTGSGSAFSVQNPYFAINFIVKGG